MTTNLHDKMLAAIDAYFSASNEIEAHVAEEQLLDVRDELLKHELAADSITEGLRLDDWDKIGCVNHDCDQCKALAEQPAPVQEPVADVRAYAYSGVAKNGEFIEAVLREGAKVADGDELFTTPQPPAPAQPLTDDKYEAIVGGARPRGSDRPRNSERKHMTTQTEAERLAVVLMRHDVGRQLVIRKQAAAELRRLVSFNQQLMDEVARLQKREWVGLSERDRDEIIRATERDDRGYVMALVEAKLKEKNR